MNIFVRDHNTMRSRQDHWLLLSIEGIDQTGKTEITRAVREIIENRGLSVKTLCDPPRLPPWNRMKRSLFDRPSMLSPIAEAWLFLAARLDLVQREINPSLNDNTFVIMDRYVDSWVAYHASRLKDELGSIKSAVSFLAGTQDSLSESGLIPFPRRTWLIRDSPDVALRRKEGAKSKWENLSTQREVAKVYEILARREPERFRVVDARRAELDDITEQVTKEVLDYCLEQADNF